MTYDDAIIRLGLLMKERNTVEIKRLELDSVIFTLSRQISDLSGAIAIMEQERKQIEEEKQNEV